MKFISDYDYSLSRVLEIPKLYEEDKITDLEFVNAYLSQATKIDEYEKLSQEKKGALLKPLESYPENIIELILEYAQKRKSEDYPLVFGVGCRLREEDQKYLKPFEKEMTEKIIQSTKYLIKKEN